MNFEFEGDSYRVQHLTTLSQSIEGYDSYVRIDGVDGLSLDKIKALCHAYFYRPAITPGQVYCTSWSILEALDMPDTLIVLARNRYYV